MPMVPLPKACAFVLLALVIGALCPTTAFQACPQRSQIQRMHWRKATPVSCSRRIQSSVSPSDAAVPSSSTSDFLSALNDRVLKPVHRGLHLKLKGKAINLWGVLSALCITVSAALLMPVMFALALYADLTGDSKRRRVLDWMIHLWARGSLAASNLFFLGNTRLLGAENLPPPSETVVYVPNHTTFFDILLLSGYLPRPFKYLSKSEILDIPLVGTGMRLAKHVFLKRNDLESTVQCAQTVTQRLLDGNSMALFAEGTRSSDGRLRTFKKGAFQMAQAAGVRVVPLSIGNLHRLMPSDSWMPLAPLRHTYIKVHPPIETRGRTVKEIKAECFEAVNGGLPPYQQHVPRSTSTGSSAATTEDG